MPSSVSATLYIQYISNIGTINNILAASSGEQQYSSVWAYISFQEFTAVVKHELRLCHSICLLSSGMNKHQDDDNIVQYSTNYSRMANPRIFPDHGIQLKFLMFRRSKILLFFKALNPGLLRCNIFYKFYKTILFFIKRGIGRIKSRSRF